MEKPISFAVTPMDTAALRPQVRDALDKYSELLSRKQYPKMWAITDRLNRVEKVPPAVRERRRRVRTVLGLLDFLLSLVLLLPGLMEPQELFVPLLAGAVCFGAGVVILWRNLRLLLAILSLPLGALLLFGAVANPKELGSLLVLALVLLILGIAALVTRKRVKKDPFAQATDKLLEGKDDPALQALRVTFDDSAMTISPELPEYGQTVPYSRMVLVLETADLLFFTTDEVIVVLQKRDLCDGSLDDLRTLLQAQTAYHIL